MEKHGVPTLDLYTPSKKEYEGVDAGGECALLPSWISGSGRDCSRGYYKASENKIAPRRQAKFL